VDEHRDMILAVRRHVYHFTFPFNIMKITGISIEQSIVTKSNEKQEVAAAGIEPEIINLSYDYIYRQYSIYSFSQGLPSAM
jgi:hypothetical protein